MEMIPFAASAGAVNVLQLPSSVREYISEKAAARSFNLESFAIRHEADPNRVVIDLGIGPKGAEQLEPFTVSLSLGDEAAQQLLQALEQVLATRSA